MVKFYMNRMIALVLAVFCLVVACSPQKTITGQTSQTSNQFKSLTVGVNPWPGFSGEYVALEKGLFKAEGVDVKEIFFQDTSSSLTAFLAGRVDVSWNSTADAIQVVNQDPSIKIIMHGDYSDGSDGILGRGITKTADLKGKQVARENLLFENILLQSYLEKGGLTLKDVNPTDTPAPGAAAAFIAKKVDVAVTYEPWMTKAAKEGNGKIIFSTKGTNVIADVLLTRNKVIQEKKTELLAYLRAIDKAVKLVNGDSQEALKIVGKKLGVSPEQAKQQLNGVKIFDLEGNKNISFNPSAPNNLMSNLKFTTKVASQLKVTPKLIDAATLYNDSLVKSL